MKYWINMLMWAVVFAVGLEMVVAARVHFAGWVSIPFALIGILFIFWGVDNMPKRKKDTFHWFQVHVTLLDKDTDYEVYHFNVRLPLLTKRNIVKPRYVRRILGAAIYTDQNLYGTRMEYTVLSYLGEFEE